MFLYNLLNIQLHLSLSFVNLHLLLAQTDKIIIKEIDESVLVNYNKDIPLDTNLILITMKTVVMLGILIKVGL